MINLSIKKEEYIEMTKYELKRIAIQFLYYILAIIAFTILALILISEARWYVWVSIALGTPLVCGIFLFCYLFIKLKLEIKKFDSLASDDVASLSIEEKNYMLSFSGLYSFGVELNGIKNVTVVDKYLRIKSQFATFYLPDTENVHSLFKDYIEIK